MKNKYRSWLICLIIICWTSLANAGTYSVTNTNDAGSGSLRQAIIDADNKPGADTIVFNIPDSDLNYNSTTGVWTIKPTSELPAIISDSTILDGTTQTANHGDTNPNGPEIEIDGTNVNGNGFTIFGLNNIIKGLIINRFSENGVLIEGYSARRNTIAGNYIGTNANGTSALPNNAGIRIYNGAQFNVVGGSTVEERNIISGNNWYGITIRFNCDNNEVIGNYIGSDVNGEVPLGNELGGIIIQFNSNGNRIGGSSEAEKNLIVGSTYVGNVLHGNGITIWESNYNIIIGNYIGTNKEGAVSLGNSSNGISMYDSQNNIIGGMMDGEGNIISGNYGTGILIRPSLSMHNAIICNYIGTDTTGQKIIRNKYEGIQIDYGANNNIVGPGNVIKYNGSVGIRVKHETTINNTIKQNFITENSNEGIRLEYGAKDNVIGPGNVIKSNGSSGIVVCHDTTIRNTILQNSVTENYYLGILNEDGGNEMLAPPTINASTNAFIAGTVCPGCIVEIFSDAYDEGAIYEGSVNADAYGNFEWIGAATGPFITTTATDSAGNTSQFSSPSAIYVENNILHQNYPNPFTSSTVIKFEISSDSYITLKIFDLKGREIITLVNEYLNTGYFTVFWNGLNSQGNSVASGFYLYRLEFGCYSITKKLLYAGKEK